MVLMSSTQVAKSANDAVGRTYIEKMSAVVSQQRMHSDSL